MDVRDDEVSALDLAFVVDTTGSMTGLIASAQQRMIAMIDALLRADEVSLRLGIVEYRDHPPQDTSFVSKVVPLTADIEAGVSHESTTTLMGVPMGSAKAEVTAPAKIQYYVPMKNLSLDDFYFDESGKRLVVKISRPILDTDMVVVNIDPDRIAKRTEFGWSPFSMFKGEGVRQEAQRHLKEAALEQGRHELLVDRAEKNLHPGDLGSAVGAIYEMDWHFA